MTVASHSIQATRSQPALGQKSLTLVQWLSALHGIQPLTQLTLLGAGSGYSEVLTWAAEHAIENVGLVEASQQQFRQLSARWQAAQPQWQLYNVVMDTGGEKAGVFYIASNTAESGLLPLAALTPLWPNITENESQPCEPATIAEWASAHWQSPGQWLFTDYFCDASVLATYAAEFEKVDVLRVRVSTEETLPKAITACEWEPALKQAGFKVINRECERHPHIENWLCVKQLNSETSSVKAELVQAQIELDEVKEQLRNTQTWFKNRKQQALEYDKKVASLEYSLKKVTEELARAQEQSSQLDVLKETLKQLALQVSEGFMEQSEQRRQTANALGQHVTRMFKEPKSREATKEKDNL